MIPAAARGDGSTPWLPRHRSGVLLLLGLALPAGMLSGLGYGGAVAVGVPALIACVAGLLGEAMLFLAITTAISGIGFYWLEGGIQLAGQGINISGLYWGLLLATSAALLLRRRPERLPRPLVLYGIFLLLSVAGLLWTPSFFEGVRHLGLYLLPALMAGVVLAYVRRESDARWLLGAYWLAFLLAVAVALGMSIRRWSMGEGGGLTGGVGERTLAIFLLPLMALALASARHRSRWFFWVTAAVALAGFATLSRTAVFVMLILPLLASLGVPLLKRLAVVWVTVVLAVGALQFEAFRERFGTGELRVTEVGVQGAGRDAALSAGRLNLSGRGWIWLHVGRHAVERPVFGHGTGSATAYMTELPGAREVHPHNDYLRAFHDLGAIGLTAVLVFGLGTMWYFRRTYLEARTPLTRELALASYLATAAYGMIAVTDNPVLYATFFTQNVFVLYALTEVAARSASPAAAPADDDGRHSISFASGGVG